MYARVAGSQGGKANQSFLQQRSESVEECESEDPVADAEEEVEAPGNETENGTEKWEWMGVPG